MRDGGVAGVEVRRAPRALPKPPTLAPPRISSLLALEVRSWETGAPTDCRGGGCLDPAYTPGEPHFGGAEDSIRAEAAGKRRAESTVTSTSLITDHLNPVDQWHTTDGTEIKPYFPFCTYAGKRFFNELSMFSCNLHDIDAFQHRLALQRDIKNAFACSDLIWLTEEESHRVRCVRFFGTWNLDS